MRVIEYENVMVRELEAGGPVNHDNTITITFKKRGDCRIEAGSPRILLAERIAALVVFILILRSWWHSQAWLQTAVVLVLHGAGRIFHGLALVLHLCAALSTPIALGPVQPQ